MCWQMAGEMFENMDKLYSLFVLIFFSLPVFSQKIRGVEVTSVMNSKLDTNTVVYDADGQAISHAKYVELIYSGDYATQISSVPGESEPKLYIKKLSPAEQIANADRITKSMAARNSVLQLNSELNLAPFYTKLAEENFDGKVKVLVFWSSECVSCTQSFQYINDVFWKTYNPNKAIILAITNEDELKAQLKLIQTPLLYAKLVSNGRSITSFYNLRTYPTFVIADRDNVIRFAVSGAGPQVISAFKTQLRALLN